MLPQTQKSKEKSGTATTASADNSNAKPAGAAGTYKVQEGDTLSRIAKKTGVGVTAIKEANGLSDGLIRVGQTPEDPGRRRLGQGRLGGSGRDRQGRDQRDQDHRDACDEAGRSG